MSEEWITVKEAAKIRNCTERNVLRLIEKKEVEAKREGHRWLIKEDSVELKSEESPTESELMSVLKVQLQEKDSQISKLQDQLEEMRKDSAESSGRHDTIVLQLTRQIEQSQRLLEHHQEPFYRRWFKRKRSGDN